MTHLYNHSKYTLKEEILVQPTETTPGLVRSLHATKGWRTTRIDALGSRVHELREKLGRGSLPKMMRFGMGG